MFLQIIEINRPVYPKEWRASKHYSDPPEVPFAFVCKSERGTVPAGPPPVQKEFRYGRNQII